MLAALLLGVGSMFVAGCGTGETATGTTPSAPSTDAKTDTTFPFTVPGGAAGDFEEREVTVGSDPYAVPGTLRIPDTASPDEPVPGAVVVGDFGAYDEDGTVLGRKPLRDLGEGMAERGVATLTYEKRTFTYQDRLAEDASVGLLADTLDDAASALAILRGAEGVDADRLFVVGHGFGGSVSPRIAEAGGGVSGLILLASPTRPMQAVLVDEARYLAELDGSIDEEEQQRINLVESQGERIDDPALVPEVNPGEALGASGLWWLDQRGYDAATAVAHAPAPALVVLGGRDYRANQLDREGWEAVAAAYPRVRVEVFEDLDHLLAPGQGPSTSDDYARAAKVDPRVLDTIVDFIQSPPA